MKTYDLYGTSDTTTEETARSLQSVLGVPFEPRRSGFIGDYYRTTVGEEVFSVEPNGDDERDEEELLEPGFAGWPTLIYVDRTERGDEIEQVLTETAGLGLLRRETVDRASILTLYER